MALRTVLVMIGERLPPYPLCAAGSRPQAPLSVITDCHNCPETVTKEKARGDKIYVPEGVTPVNLRPALLGCPQGFLE